MVAAALDEDRTHVCTVALYSTRPPDDAREQALAGLQHETPFAALLPDGLYKELLDGTSDQLPRITAFCPAVTIAALPEQVDLHDASTMLLSMPSGAHVVALWLTYEVRGRQMFRPLPELYDVIDAGRWSMVIRDTDLLSCAVAGGTAVPDRLRLGPDFHAVTFLPPGAWEISDELDIDLAQRLVSRQDRPSRRAFMTARLPAEGNRYPDMLTAVTPGASAVAGHAEAACTALFLSASEVVACLSSLRQLQRRAFARLTTLETQPDAETLEEQLTIIETDAAELRTLQLDLSFSVECFLDIRLLVPSLPVQQFHRELIEALAVPEGARVTGAMLSRLESASSARAQELAVQRDRNEVRARLERDDRRARTQNVVGLLAAIAIPITLIVAFLGANVSEVGTTNSLWDARFYPWYACFIGLPILAIVLSLLFIRRMDRR